MNGSDQTPISRCKSPAHVRVERFHRGRFAMPRQNFL
jgi:hypothetical protein